MCCICDYILKTGMDSFEQKSSLGYTKTPILWSCWNFKLKTVIEITEYD